MDKKWHRSGDFRGICGKLNKSRRKVELSPTFYGFKKMRRVILMESFRFLRSGETTGSSQQCHGQTRTDQGPAEDGHALASPDMTDAVCRYQLFRRGIGKYAL